jgi:hypothetical protein
MPPWEPSGAPGKRAWGLPGSPPEAPGARLQTGDGARLAEGPGTS